MLTSGPGGPATPPGPPHAPALRWGTHTERLVASLALTISGAVAITSGNTFAFFQIVLGASAFAVGWIIIPGRLARRMATLLPAFLGVAALLVGAQGIPLLVLPFLAWLYIRERPAAAYLAVLPLLVFTIAVANTFRGFDYMAVALGTGAAAVVGCAWFAAALGRRFPGRGRQAALLPH